jgi:hypothetical protein
MQTREEEKGHGEENQENTTFFLKACSFLSLPAACAIPIDTKHVRVEKC